MSSTTVSSSNCHHLFNKALADYADHTGIDLEENPFAEKLQSCDSANAIFELLQERAKAFKEYRDGNRKLIDCLSPVVQVLHTFSGILGEATALVPFPPAKAIFVGVDVLFAAACGVRLSYDALVDLFECVGHFLKRLQIYTEILLTPAMSEIIVKIMVEVLSVLALATKQIKQGRFKKFAKKLFGESEIEAVLQRLGRLTDEEARMTVAQTLEVVHGLVNNVKVVMDDGKASTNDILHALVTMQEAINEINKMKREQLPKGVPTWLSPPDPSKNHNISRRNHHSGTAAWFTHGCIFEEWKTTGSLLWIHGKPGSGKSVLCSAIIQEIKAIYDAGLALMGYFYCDFRDTAKQDVTGLLTSLISQLSTTSDLCYDILSDLYSRHNAGSLQPDDDALMQCLKDILEVAGQPLTYIVVDALDECPNTSGVVSNRGRVLRLVKELVNLELPNLRLRITSRREADIVATLEPLASHTVSLQDQTGQKNDIAEYIKYVIHSDPRTRRWREDKELVIDILVRNADGMFRWVVCQLETLLRCFPASLRVALNKLPKTLDETYHRILLGIEEENREYAHRLLQCLTVSFRPLRVEELAEVLAIRFDNGDAPNYHPDWRMEDAREAVLSACSSLIAIVNVDGSSIVQFSHFSVKEFLISDRLADASKNLSRYHVLLRPAHTILAQASLSALLRLDDQVDKSSMKNYPLSIYAAQHWVEHGQFENVSSYIQALMEQLFDPSKPHLSTWVWIYDVDRPWDWVDHMSSERPRRPEAVALYYATLCGFRSLMEHLIANYPGDVNALGGTHSTPLHAALKKRYFDIALMLLEHGADVNILDEWGDSPLHKASVKGHRDTVAFLLARKKAVKVHRKGKIATLRRTLMALKKKRKKKGGIALDGTRQNGELDATRGSLWHEVAVDFRNSEGRTALALASQFRHLDTVQLLLENGTAVDAHGYEGWTALGRASAYGHLDVVQLLLQNGAAVDSRSNDGTTPLQAASRSGHRDVVQLLLENGAAVGAHSHGGWTSLGYASVYGHLDVVQLLLQNGAAVDSRSNNGTTPSQAASRFDHRDVVQLLLENGAAVGAHDHEGWTSLGSASSYGHLDVVQLLLQNGAAVDFRSNNGTTPLHVASASGHRDVVRLLLENGAAVDAHSHEGWTPLGNASSYGHLDVVQLLLQNGAAIDSCSNDGRTPLQEASRNGHLDIVHLLLQNGTPVDSHDYNGWTACHKASWNGYLDIVKLLLDSGSDVSTRDRNKETPLDLACRNGKRDVATFLAELMGTEIVDCWIGKGMTTVDVASQNAGSNFVGSSPSRGENADVLAKGNSLHTASKEGNLDTVRSLLDHGADVNEQDPFKQTPLHVASWKGRLEVAKFLIQHDANVDIRDKFGKTSLHLASRFGHLDVVRLLLDQGVDTNAKTLILWTPLHLASSHGHLEVVKLLLERGANVHVQSEEGWTPSQVALIYGRRGIARLLSEYGAH